jgi:hypothetical protein
VHGSDTEEEAPEACTVFERLPVYRVLTIHLKVASIDDDVEEADIPEDLSNSENEDQTGAGADVISFIPLSCISHSLDFAT